MGPNGSGKSTLVEAISWVLYGSGSVDRTDKEGIKRSGAGSNDDCSVKIIFELGGVQYQVRRAMRGKNLKADAEILGNGEVLASTERTVTAQVEKILGMDHRSFFLSVFARQKELSALSALTPAERKKLIVRMLDLDVLQRVIDDIKRDERDEKADLQFVNEQLLTVDRRPKREVLTEERTALEEELASLRRQFDAANQDVARLEAELEKAKGHKEWVALKEEEFRQHDRRLSRKRDELEELNKRKQAVEKDITALQSRLSSLPDLKARKEEHDSLLRTKESMDEGFRAHLERAKLLESLQRSEDDMARAERTITDATTERNALKDPQGNLDRVIENLEALDSEIVGTRERISSADAEVRGLRKEVSELERKREEVISLGPDSICPTCQRPMGDQHTHLVSALDEQHEAADASIARLEGRLGELREMLQIFQLRKGALEERKKKLQASVNAATGLDERLKHANESLASLTGQRDSLSSKLAALSADQFDEAAYQAIKERLPGLRAAADRFQTLTGEATRLPELQARLDELNASIVLRTNEVKIFQDDLAAVGYTEGDLKKAQSAYEAALQAREGGYNEVSMKVMGIEHTQQRLDDKNKAIAEIKDMERSVDGRTMRVQELAMLARVMGDFKQNVMERITPTLSEIASDLFVTMTDSKYGGIELDDNYDIQIYDGGEKYPLSRFSGGESDLANLCLRLAISRVLADRSGNDINFLILDEIFGSQDQVRKRAIMETLNHLEKRFHQIVLITHIDDTKDMMSNVVTVKEMDDGSSDILL